MAPARLLVAGPVPTSSHFPSLSLSDVKIIQLDICPEQIGVNVPAAVGLVGDAKVVCGQLADAAAAGGLKYPAGTPWWATLNEKVCMESRR